MNITNCPWLVVSEALAVCNMQGVTPGEVWNAKEWDVIVTDGKSMPVIMGLIVVNNNGKITMLNVG